MRKITVFNFITLNGFFKGPGGDISWHKQQQTEEEKQFAAEGAQSGNTLLFGRVTYDMMAGYWPSPMAQQNDPGVAAGINAAEKIVFSRTLKKADWNNTRIVKDPIKEEVKKMKGMSGKDMTILGSGSIVTLLSEEGLIDEYQFMIDPVALGEGTPLFKGMKRMLDLKHIATRTFKNGIVLLSYEPAKNK